MHELIILSAKYLFLFVIAGIGVTWLLVPKDQKLKAALSIIAAGVIAVVLSRIASKLYYDPRPFVTEHVKPLIAHANDNGFPSDHALLTMTLTAIAYFYNKKIALAMLLLTVIVGVARILAKIHSPLDIGAGWLFGIIGAVAGYYIVHYFWTRPQSKAQPPKA